MDYSSLPIFVHADVVVCGGGVAGTFAAKSAADMGCDVLIVEQYGCLGGTATNGLVCPVMHTHIPENPQCSYISNIVRDKMLELDACDKSGLRFDPLVLKIVLEEICAEAKIKLLYHTFISDTVTNNGKVESIVVSNKNGLGIIKGKIFIDATGDADICVRAGAEYTKGNPETGKNQPISLRYMVANVDFEAFGAQILSEIDRTGKIEGTSYYDKVIYAAVCHGDQWTFADIFDTAIANGDLIDNDKAYWQCFTVPNRKNALAFNNPEFFDNTDGTDPENLTNTQLLGKKAILRQMRFYKKYLKGFDDAYVAEIAPMVGIRESRNVITEYVLTAEDLICRRKFDGMICQSNYPVDIHGKKLNFNKIKTKMVDDGKNWYEIPYTSLVVKNFDNLFVVGRCLGAEFVAQSSLRVQQSCRASGEAAGIAAAIALDQNLLPQEINGADVRNIMIKLGAHFL